MSYWICCNVCFLPPGAERKLAVTTCGHVVCSVCFQKGEMSKPYEAPDVQSVAVVVPACRRWNDTWSDRDICWTRGDTAGTQGICLICNAKSQVSPLSDKSSSEVKALFSDINVVANKQMKEVSHVIMFQARQQKRLLTHYQQRNEKLEEVLVKMKQEMQQMTKKLNEQSAYISKLENCLQHQSVKASPGSQMSHSSHTPHGHKSVLQIPYNSPICLSRHPSSTSISENMDVDERSLFRKPKIVPRLSLISPPQDERMGSISLRSSNRNTLANHSTRSATVSRFQGAPLTPDVSYGWTSPIFKPPSSFRHSMSSLVCLPP
ncbi:putative E3 SUMO-protein ligase RNF212 isoform 4 [Scophthalmus maximus]|uniref:Putative E3 SUMO-protein ligase RNF212 isoform 4 n=1 Tax=Scophthalmus maximus TaxID=52904 RepID=A0A2U9C5C2_SCOMX|nr:probable E3 SUMO-protein ligase RNF212 isoform X1 [Scophthalmus maximus]XP_035505254.2 probable E3 SUMO-protein ligase RNF212 isoform X1 [Scophthalmus maximus]XP_035505255.2 probable E3 SUMO-protein ligase RNF212 isoform X1 [Scophthalmus maximus]XP_035505256.2 probable E3 SUMO-protein ligase RNF212 isoform X1 [Scophthalmus maximus]AWP11771.1 putative E3 SUMO-protein ligase RNF212 isoform 4 [Scophthalmus maximus]